MTTDELFALGLERTRILAAMIDNGRSWYLGRRMRRPEEMMSSYFDPKRGLGIDYFRKTIRHLADGGFKKVNMKSDAAVAFRRGNEHVLTLLREMEPLLAQHVSKEDANAYRLALYFFRSGQDMFFDMLPRFEPILRPTIRKMKVEAFCIDSLQRYLGAIARAFAIREAQLTGAKSVPETTATLRKPPAELDTILSCLTENNRILRSVRNTQRKASGLAAEPRRSSECDRWCYERWSELKGRTDLIEAPITKERVLDYLYQRKSITGYLKEHGITLPRHFAAAIDNGRKAPEIVPETSWN